MKKLLTLFGLSLLLATSAHAAPTFRQEAGLVPITDSEYYLGTTTPTTKAWKGLIVDEICFTADSCETTWSSGGSQTPWTSDIDADQFSLLDLFGLEATNSTTTNATTTSLFSTTASSTNLFASFFTLAGKTLSLSANATLGGTNTGDVTLAGTPDYITISGQQITRGTIDISDDTNLTAGDALTITGDDLDFDGLAVNGALDTPAYSFANDTNTGMFLVSGGILGFSIDGTGHAALSTTQFYPYSNDATALGSSGNAWSDLYLASGGIIDWGNNNVRLTQSSGNLTLSSGDIFNASDAIFTNSTTTNATSTSLFSTTGNFTNLCIASDCKTAWPASGGGSGSVATSSAETSGRVPFWTSTAATPATLSGGNAGFTFDSAATKLTSTNIQSTNSTSTNATTTNLAITGLATPAGAFLAVNPNGLVISTTTPSSSGGFLAVGPPASVADATTNEKTIATVSVPGGTLGTANAIRGSIYVSDLSMGGSLADPVFRLKYGATTLATMTLNQTDDIDLAKGYLNFVLFANASASAQRGVLILDLSLDHITGNEATQVEYAWGYASGAATENSAGALTLSVTVQFANANSDNHFNIDGYIIE